MTRDRPRDVVAPDRTRQACLPHAQDDVRAATSDAARARCEREIRIAAAQIQAAGG